MAERVFTIIYFCSLLGPFFESYIVKENGRGSDSKERVRSNAQIV